MPTVEHRAINLDLESIAQHAITVAEVVGKDWLKRKRKEAKAQPKNRKLGGYATVYQRPYHPLVAWALAYELWWQKLRETKQIPLSEPVLQLALLGEALELTRSLKGFHRIVHRLKQLDEFEAAAFEVEVAASYVARGYAVEFIEESIEKTPDLKIVIPNDIPESTGKPSWSS